MKHIRFTAMVLTVAATLTLSQFAVAQKAGSGQRTTYSEALAQHPGWVQIPGELIRPDCVHAVPSGAKVTIGADGMSGDVSFNGEVVAHYDPCPESPVVTRPSGMGDSLQNEPPSGNGWVEASNWLISLGGSDNIDLIQGNWKVPKNPKINGGLIYLFNGMEDSTFAWILQPVLQYGVGYAGGGNYWVVASWLVGSSAYFSPLEGVNPGDSLTGYTKMTGDSGGTLDFKIQATDNTTGAYSWLDASSTGLQWTWALAGVLEAYNINECSNFPKSGDAVFSKTVLDHGYPKFEALKPPKWGASYWNYGGPSCSFHVTPGSTSTLKF